MINKKYFSLLTKKKQGVFISAIITLFVIIIIFNNTLLHLNSTSFSSEGDGMQIYYTSAYHAQFDDDLWSQKCINYPYKENVFFTACQPLLTIFLKIFHLGRYTFGFTNFLMLFSLILCSIYLFLIFNRLKLNHYFSIISACSITFLSPQIVRFTGHFVLTYQFAIPAIIYYMLVFVDNPNIKNSIKISSLVFIISTIHLYFFGFYAVIILSFYLGILIKKVKSLQSFGKYFLYFFSQLILPYLLLILILNLGVNYTDRSKFPFGFLEYISNMYGIFYPFNLPQEKLFIQVFGNPINCSYEGKSYIGIISILTCVILLCKIIYNLLTLKFKNILAFTPFFYINILILVSILNLLYSFGYPFILGYEKLLNKLSIVAQMRASGRFSWLFFYIINITSVITLSIILNKIKNNFLKYFLFGTSVFIFGFEAYLHSYECLNNKQISLKDFTAISKQQKFYTKNVSIDISQFQAILPLPYYLVGSESTGFACLGNIQRYSYLVSLETSLPLISATGSRLSLSKSFNHIPIGLEPTGLYPLCYKDFPNNKNILIITDNVVFKDSDKKLLPYCELLLNQTNFSLYKLTISNLKKFYNDYYLTKTNEINAFNNDSINQIKTEMLYNPSYLKNQTTFFSNFKRERANSYNVIYDDTLIVKFQDISHYISFWYKDFDKDRYSRTSMEVISYNDSLKNYTSILYGCSGDYLKQFYNGFGLIEFRFVPIKNHNKLRVVLWNNQLGEKDSLSFCNVLIRNDSINVYKKIKNTFIKNNYIYLK